MSGRAAVTTDRDVAAAVDAWLDDMHDASQNIVGNAASATTVCQDVIESLHDDRTHDPGRDPGRDSGGDPRRDDLTIDMVLLAIWHRSLQHLDTHGWHEPAAGELTFPARADSSAQHRSAIRYRVMLARAGATVIGAGNASLLDLHIRHGVDAATLAEPLGVDPADAPLRLAQLRARLDDAIAAFILWNNARPTCADLATELDDNHTFGSSPFGTIAFGTIDHHHRSCDQCTREHQLLINPAGLLLTAPVTPVASAIRTRLLAVASNTDGGWATDLVAPASPANSSAAKPSEDEIAELWASTAIIEPTSDDDPVPLPTNPHIRPRIRQGRRVALVAAVALMVAGTGAVVLATRPADDGSRTVVDAPPGADQPDDRSDPAADDGSDPAPEPEVRSLAPAPVTAGLATPTTTEASPSTTTTTAPVSTAGADTVTSPAPTPPRVATGSPPRPPATSPTSTATTSPVTTTPEAAPATTTPTATIPTTTPETTTPETTTPETTTPETTTPETTTPETTTPSTTGDGGDVDGGPTTPEAGATPLDASAGG